ncbi:hypothetical protein AB6A40_010376 [Gnathostoma spinigerum]|uniref:Uncharacterized protein n=1 Tax=Gnathostoma spinigerum TaxID=75299 RepID=A0ABD6EX22_9BILA
METCIDSVKRIVTWIFIAFGFSVAIRFLFLLDLNKRVYNHVPGDCRIVNKITNGSAGIELVDELGVAFITSGLAKVRGVQRVVGRIHMYNFTQNNRKFEANRIRIEGSEFDRRSFTPNGISSYVSNGRVTLYVINNRPGNHSVEVFSYDKDRNSLTHRKSIHDPTFTNPFDIAAVGPDRFFLTNYVYMDKRWAQLVELAFQTSFGSIVYYDGKKTSYLEK